MATNLGFYPARSFGHGRGRWSGRQDVIVFHTTSGAAGLKEYEANTKKNEMLFTGSMGWFCLSTTTAQTSSHFITDRGGRYLQVVKLSDTAYCNGNNAESRRDPRVKDIIRNRVDNANLYTYSIESEGTYGSVGDPPNTKEQFDAIVECMKICIDDMYNNGVVTFIPDDQHLIGHCHISPKNRYNCPAANGAANYPFDELIRIAKDYCDSKYPGWIKYPEADNGSTSIINIGDRVQIISGATWYGSMRKISDIHINGKTYTVDSLNGDRAVLDKNGINSPIDVKYLKIVGNIDLPSDPTTNIDVGDIVTINSGAVWYNSSSRVPKWAIGTPYRVDSVNGNKLLLDKSGINSTIDSKYVTKEMHSITVGSNVRILPGAYWWGDKTPVPKWAIGNPYQVGSISDNKVLIGPDSIRSYIHIKYLENV